MPAGCCIQLSVIDTKGPASGGQRAPVSERRQGGASQPDDRCYFCQCQGKLLLRCARDVCLNFLERL